MDGQWCGPVQTRNNVSVWTLGTVMQLCAISYNTRGLNYLYLICSHPNVNNIDILYQ